MRQIVRCRWATLALPLTTIAAPLTASLGAQRPAQRAAQRAARRAARPPAITVAGRGLETYVLLSGLVGGVAGFRWIEARLVAQGYRVVAIDPYHLSLDSADVTFDALGRRVDRVLAERGVTAASVVGHAHGGGVALSGAWKDAPREGFAPLKFCRSPALTAALALLLSRLTDSDLQAAVAALGYERAIAETYKTFCFPDTPRGKFAGKPIRHPEMLVRRRYFAPVYVGIWLAVVVAGVLALRAAAPSRSAADSAAGRPTGERA
jgi:pimeloyl-ACP methyl ester carboxylesterase